MSASHVITIIGAGVVGLAIAAEVSAEGREVYVLEKNETFGLEISSRQSGVIHSGIYYPENSLKARLCVAGSRKLYDLCQRYDIGYRRLGKLIVATSDEEVAQIEGLLERGRRNGATDLRMLSREDIKKLEPNVEGVAAILSPSTGIIDSHVLLRYCITRAKSLGAQIVYHTEVTAIQKMANGYRVTVADRTGKQSFTTRIIINSAGLHCDKVAALAGIDISRAGYQLHYCKGEYFSGGSRNARLVRRLIYPVPQSDLWAGHPYYLRPRREDEIGPQYRVCG